MPRSESKTTPPGSRRRLNGKSFFQPPYVQLQFVNFGLEARNRWRFSLRAPLKFGHAAILCRYLPAEHHAIPPEPV